VLEQLYREMASAPTMLEIALKFGVAATAGVAAAALCHPVARKIVYPPRSEAKLRDHILFDSVLEDGQTIRCEDGTLFVTISVSGIDLTALMAGDQDDLEKRRTRWIEGLVEYPAVSAMVITTRRLEDRVASHGEYGNAELERLHSLYQQYFSRGYRNTHTVVLTVEKGADGGRAMLRDAVEHTTNTLTDFTPVILHVGKPGEPSPLLGFWYALLNPTRGTRTVQDRGHDIPNIGLASWAADETNAPDYSVRDALMTVRMGVSHGLTPPDQDISLGDLLVRTRARMAGSAAPFDDDGVVEWADGVDEKKLMAAVGITKTGSAVSTEIFNDVLSVPAEMLAVQWFKVYDRATAAFKLDDRRKKTVGGERFARSAIEQIDAALNNVSSQNGDYMVRHQTHVFLYADTLAELKRHEGEVRNAFGNYQNWCVFERDAVEPLFLSLFPPHLEWTRDQNLMTPNVADLVSFETPVRGVSRCDWGQRPVTVFPTLRGTTYSFCWHKDPTETKTPSPPAGHTAIFGPTGGGKTFLTNFLATGSLGYEDACVFLFDRYEGAFVPTEAFGGEYVHFHTGEDDVTGGCELNPLHMDLAKSHVRNWMISWLRDLVLQSSDPEVEDHLSRVITGMADLPVHKRSFEELLNNLPQDLEGRHELQRFVGGAYGGLLNAERDTLSMTHTRLVGFNFTRILEDDVLVRTVLPYIMFRIENEMAERNAPYLLVFDETHALFRNKVMADWIIKQLQEGRKNRAVVVMCFQRVGTLREYGGQELLTLTPTRIVLPNPEAGEEEYRNFLGLSASEFEMIKGRSPSVQRLDHFALVCRDGEGSVVLNTDMKDRLRTENGQSLIPLFASGKVPADLARQCQNVMSGTGAGGAEWVGRYLEESSRPSRQAAE